MRTGLDSYSSVHKGKNIIQEVDVLSLDIQDHIWFHIQAHIWPHISLTSRLFFFNLTFVLKISLQLASLLTFFFNLTFGLTISLQLVSLLTFFFSLPFGLTISLHLASHPILHLASHLAKHSALHLAIHSASHTFLFGYMILLFSFLTALHPA